MTAANNHDDLLRVDAWRGREWDETVPLFNDGVIDQTFSYAKANWGESRLSTIAVERDGQPLGACLLVIVRVPLLGAGVAVAKFGPMYRRAGQASAARMVAALVEEYVERRGLMLRVMPRPDASQACDLTQALTAAGFSHVVPDDPYRYLVSLAHDDGERMAGLKPKWRAHLRKALRGNLRIDLDHSDGRVERFRELYRRMRSRKDFADVRALDRLHDFADDKTLQFFVACAGEEPVAAAAVSSIGDTAIYLLGASNERGRQLRAGYALHFAIAGILRDDGRLWYDLGGDCNDKGLRQFKSGLTGRLGLIATLPGAFDKSNSTLSSLFGRAIFGLRARRANGGNRRAGG